MLRSSRVLIATASILLGLVFVFPLWRIELQAPQYPEGLGLLIKISDITGVKKHDLQNINGLNHYIGMKSIEPDSIPELKFMPVFVAVMIAAGLLVAATGNRVLLYLWVGVFLIGSVAGLVDFWLWSYDYGHNLDPTAAIKVPGMTYQPPLIGSKQLLNFVATSWPGLGGLAAMVSVGTGSVVAVREWRRARRGPEATG
jgi:copper chaperone NosL